MCHITYISRILKIINLPNLRLPPLIDLHGSAMRLRRRVSHQGQDAELRDSRDVSNDRLPRFSRHELRVEGATHQSAKERTAEEEAHHFQKL